MKGSADRWRCPECGALMAWDAAGQAWICFACGMEYTLIEVIAWEDDNGVDVKRRDAAETH